MQTEDLAGLSNEGSKVSLLHLTPYTEYAGRLAKRAFESGSDSLPSGRPGPFCFLLEIDSAKILLDAGAVQRDNTLGFEHLQPLKKAIKEVDAILCTHAHLDHVGGLPFLYGRLGAQCPVYTTLATSMMAQIVLSDALFATSAELYQEAEPAEGPASEDSPVLATHLKAALGKMVGLRYSQPISLHGKAEGISIAAFPAGHSLGGCYWRIRKGSEDLIYAVRINHKKERHLDGTQLLHLTGARPSVLITDATAALAIAQNRKARDSELIDIVISHLRHAQGSVLMPVDPAGRLLELLLLLDSAWTLHRVPYPIYLVGPESSRLLEYVRSMLEWMGESVIKSFGANRENPFELKHVKAVATVEALHAAVEAAKSASGTTLPKVVLATTASLSYGPSRRLFYEWAALSDHLVLFTMPPSSAPPDSLAGQLARFADAKVKPASLPFKLAIRTPLEGPALQQYLARRKKILEASSAALALPSGALLSSERAEELVVDYSDDDDDDNGNGGHGNSGNGGVAAADKSSAAAEAVRSVERPVPVVPKDTFPPAAMTPSKSSMRAAAAPSYQDPALWSWSQSWSFDYVTRQPLPFLSCLPKALKRSGQPAYPILFPIAGSEARRIATPYGELLQPADWPAFKFEDIDEKAREETKPKDAEASLLSGELREALDHLKILSTGEKQNAVAPSALQADASALATAGAAKLPSLPVVRTEWHAFQGPISCSVKWIDMDGVCDGRSLKTILGQIQPRKLVLVHGDTNSVQYLYQSTRLSRSSASPEAANSTLIAVDHLERLNISILSNMYQLKLSDALLSSLQLARKGDYTLARLHGTVKCSAALEEQVPSIDLPAQHEKDLSSLLYHQWRHGGSMAKEAAKRATPCLVGELRLPELRRKLQKLGHSAEFSEGKLIVDRSVAVYKHAQEEICIEGPTSPSYYNARQLLYQQFVRL